MITKNKGYLTGTVAHCLRVTHPESGAGPAAKMKEVKHRDYSEAGIGILC